MKITLSGRVFEVSDEQIAKAIEEKTDVTIEGDFVVRERAEEDTFVNNLKADAKKAGVEIAVKEARATLGLDFQGKTVDNLIDAVKTKTLEDAKIEPEAKVRELMKDIDTLKGTIGTLTTEKDQLQKEFHGFKSESAVNSVIASAIPENATLPKDDMLLLIKNKMSFEMDETSRVIVKNPQGEIMKNATTLDPLQPKDVITQFFNDNPVYLKGTTGGNGGDDTPPAGGKVTTEKFIEQQKAAGISHTDPRFNDNYNEAIKQGLIAD